MNTILQLAKSYSKEKHKKILPNISKNILDDFCFLYDENWERKNSYPYEILTYLFDSYYVLPERPDLASLFCWQALNNSYYSQQLSDNNIERCTDTRGIQCIVNIIIKSWDIYGLILEPYLNKLPLKAFRYISSYLLKGYLIKQQGISEKYAASEYKSLEKKVPCIKNILESSYGKAYCKIAKPAVIDNKVNFGISDAQKEKSREITQSFAIKLKKLALGKEVELTLCDLQEIKKKYKLTYEERLSLILFGILYASRCNNFHGNVAARLNSINANIDTFKMYTDIFLLEYILLAIHMNSQKMLSNYMLYKVSKNVDLML